MAVKSKINHYHIKNLLDEAVIRYNHAGFIEDDPISIPRKFNETKNMEIMGFWSAMLSWGQRKTIISKCNELIKLMEGDPYGFIMNHQPGDLNRFLTFKHRTFQSDDALAFIDFFKKYYQNHDSLQAAFIDDEHPASIEKGLIGFKNLFFNTASALPRTQKHISTPARDSACKRLNMFLRWMVRTGDRVDLGIWNKITPAALMIPLDVHVQRTAVKLGILDPTAKGWKAVTELTGVLKTFDPSDPVKYDFALFGLSINDDKPF